MWTALHWVKHNQPDYPSIDMENIFDQQRPLSNGIIMGGTGKIVIYGDRKSLLREVEFTRKPFNDLFWDLWTLFGEHLDQRRKAARKRSSDPGEYPKQDVNFDEN